MKHTARFWSRNMMMLIIVIMIRNLNIKKLEGFRMKDAEKVKTNVEQKAQHIFFLYETMIKIQKKIYLVVTVYTKHLIFLKKKVT